MRLAKPDVRIYGARGERETIKMGFFILRTYIFTINDYLAFYMLIDVHHSVKRLAFFRYTPISSFTSNLTLYLRDRLDSEESQLNVVFNELDKLIGNKIILDVEDLSVMF